MGVGQKVCALVGIIIRQALQHGKNATQLVIQKTQRVISVNTLGQQKAVHSLVQPWLVVMQEVCKIGRIIFTDSGNDVIVDVLHLWRHRVKTEDAPCLSHGHSSVQHSEFCCAGIFIGIPEAFFGHWTHLLS